MKTKLLLLYIAGLLAVCPVGGNLMAQTATQPDVLKNDTVSHKLIHRLGLVLLGGALLYALRGRRQ